MLILYVDAHLYLKHDSYHPLPQKKLKNLLVKMLSQAGTGFFYVVKKGPVKNAKKLVLRKFDPIVNQHVIFTEAKMK